MTRLITPPPMPSTPTALACLVLLAILVLHLARQAVDETPAHLPLHRAGWLLVRSVTRNTLRSMLMMLELEP